MTSTQIDSILKDVKVLGAISTASSKILTKEACAFLATLHRTFDGTRRQLLLRRVLRQAEIDKGVLPDFLPETRHIRDDPTWRGADPAPGLVDRRVEITGPTDRKMVVNALNSDVWTYMADFEGWLVVWLFGCWPHSLLSKDSNSPTWDNMINGQVNLYDAVRRQIDFRLAEKDYKLRTDRPLPTLIVRYAAPPPCMQPSLLTRWPKSPRGWHLDEKHFVVDGSPISAGLFDFGLYFFHNAKQLTANGHGPYFYLPKMESHLEARLWNDVFNLAQDTLGISRGTVRSTVLIETILAAFEMDEVGLRSVLALAMWSSHRPCRSSTSCASTAPGSTVAAGTTSSV